MKYALISLIGVGRKDNANKKGYLKTKYRFEDNGVFETAFFGSALYKYLNSKGCKIDRWLIFGTRYSSWSEIIDSIDPVKYNKFIDIWGMVMEEENSGLDDTLLNNWEESLKEEIPGLRLLPVEPLDYKAYVKHLLDEIPGDDVEIIFDITHAYRFMGVILSFCLMYLKNFKQIKGLKIYYGALDMRDSDGVAPAIELDFINDIFKLSTSFETYKNSGYFPELLTNLGMNNTEGTYFKIEMNGRPRAELERIIKELKEISKMDDFRKVAADILIRDLEPLQNAEYMEDRMVERAQFFFEKKQFLKALILLYEGTIVLLGKKLDIDPPDIEENRGIIWEKINSILTEDWMRETFQNLKATRNNAVHGGLSSNLQKYVENPANFKELFQSSIKLYNYLRQTK